MSAELHPLTVFGCFGLVETTALTQCATSEATGTDGELSIKTGKREKTPSIGT